MVTSWVNAGVCTARPHAPVRSRQPTPRPSSKVFSASQRGLWHRRRWSLPSTGPGRIESSTARLLRCNPRRLACGLREQEDAPRTHPRCSLKTLKPKLSETWLPEPCSHNKPSKVHLPRPPLSLNCQHSKKPEK